MNFHNNISAPCFKASADMTNHANIAILGQRQARAWLFIENTLISGLRTAPDMQITIMPSLLQEENMHSLQYHFENLRS